MNIAFVCPHLFMREDLLSQTIFAPGHLALKISDILVESGHNVTMFTAGSLQSKAIIRYPDSADLDSVLRKYKGSVSEFIKNDLPGFRKLFNRVERSILDMVLGEPERYDVIHIFITNNKYGPLRIRKKSKPVLFTLHDPYKLVFTKKQKAHLSAAIHFNTISNNQRKSIRFLPDKENIHTVYNGIDIHKYSFYPVSSDYFASFGRIIKPKGVHHAINVCRKSGNKLKIAGLHYEGHGGDHYWSRRIAPYIDNKTISYEGFVSDISEQNRFLGEARALLFPIEWNEPFGLVILEANASGTPVIAYDHGAVREIIQNGVNGFIVKNEKEMIQAMNRIHLINRDTCRKFVQQKYSVQKMIQEYERLYLQILPTPPS